VTLVLVVDDVTAVAEQYAYDLKRLAGYDAVVARSGDEALEVLARDAVDCVILDLEMPGTDGFDVLRAMGAQEMDVPVIVYTGTGNYDRCVQAVRLGAYAFIDKAEPMERVVREVENALEKRRLTGEVSQLRRRAGMDSGLVGASPAMTRLAEAIERLAPIPSPVLVVGESGTGKELVAHDLHKLSPHARDPFVAINCAALPEQLVESELFGHERGAFTGAHRVRQGAFEVARRGTLFLDEVGELAVPAQAKLLRVLEERHLTRVGGERQVRVEARVVAATNRDLEREVAERRFREDLYFRLNVHMIEVPPLRDRRSDVPALVDHFLGVLSTRFGMRRKRIVPETLDALMGYDWHRNNVRELRNTVERMIIAARGEELTPDLVPTYVAGESARAPVSGAGGEPKTLQELKAEAERQIVVLALERNDWHITNTARELGLADHSSLIKIMRRHSLKPAR